MAEGRTKGGNARDGKAEGGKVEGEVEGEVEGKRVVKQKGRRGGMSKKGDQRRAGKELQNTVMLQDFCLQHQKCATVMYIC